jgi:membrane peptidoglycan carboxypeptidase
MAQSKDYSNDPAVLASGANYTSVNYSTDSTYGGSTGFPVGSTYKLFTLAEWLKQGHGLNEVVSGKVKDYSMSEFKNSCDPVGGPNWKPVNYAGAFDSTTTVMQALKMSYNLNFITMASKMDLCNIRKDAQAFGVHRADFKQLKSNPSTIIGTEEIAPLTMAVALAGIANDGKTCTAVAIDSITDYTGKKVDPPKTKCTQSVTPNIAHTMQYAMENVHAAGGTATVADVGDGIPWIAKTGTSDNAEQNMILGATSKVATVVWLGNVTGHVALSSVAFTHGQQYVTKQQIWKSVMAVANPKYGGDKFPDPDPNLVKGKSVSVPAIQGLTKEQAKSLIESVGLTFTDGGQMDSELPLDTVAKSEPASGEPIAVGGEVKVYFSNHTLVAGPPSTVGMTETLARSTLVAAGWTVGTTVELPIPDALCPVPLPPAPTPAPTPSASPTACPGTANPLPVGQRLVVTQTPIGGFVKPTTPIIITVQK